MLFAFSYVSLHFIYHHQTIELSERLQCTRHTFSVYILSATGAYFVVGKDLFVWNLSGRALTQSRTAPA